MVTVLFGFSVFLIVFFMMSVGLFLTGKSIQGGSCGQKSCACLVESCNREGEK